MRIKILALLAVVLTLTACRAQAQTKELQTEKLESETCWAYSTVYSGTIKITYVDEESCMVVAKDEYCEDLFFLAVTTPFAIDKEFEAVIFADGYIAVYDGETHVGTYKVHRSFKLDEALKNFEGAIADA